MKRCIKAILLGVALASEAFAQIVLTNFDTAPALFQYSWDSAANTTLAGGLLTIGGSAVNDGAFYDINPLTGSWSSFNAIQITARKDEGNTADLFNFYIDTNSGEVSYAIPVYTNLFTSTLSTVTVNIPSLGSVPPNAVEVWGITTTAGGSDAFRMTFDSIALTTIPEPSTYAAIFGALTLGGVCYRRYRRK